MRDVSLSDETYKRLLHRAESFDDSPESVVVRLLDEAEEVDFKRPTDGKAERAPAGSILAESEYWLPILRVVAAGSGSVPAADVIDILEEELGERLTELDLQRLNSGEIRWKNRARFARLRMCDRGLLSDETRGVWTITDAGRRYLEEGKGG